MYISCIIPCYNRGALLRRAVESIFLARQHEIEIIIVDDGSIDNSIQVAESLAAEHPNKIRFFQHSNRKNRGVSESRNLGLSEARGELLCFLDADDYVLPIRFDSGVELLSRNASIDGVHEIAEVQFATTESEKQWFSGDRRFGFTQKVDSDALLNHLIWGRCWATSAILFRRDLLKKTGLFNTKLHIAEDCNLWMRMAAVGKLVQGDTTRPVSVYWRTETSAYQPSSQNRLLYVRALLDFYQWAHSVVTSKKKRAIRQEIRRYLTHTAISLRETDHRIALQVLTSTLYHCPILMANATLLRQLGSLLVSSYRTNKPSLPVRS